MRSRALVVVVVAALLPSASACATAPCGVARASGPPDAGAVSPPPVNDLLVLLDRWYDNLVAMRHIPGMATVVLRGPEVVWRRDAGFADLASGRPVAPSTRFYAGSVTKLVTSVAALQLRDSGRLDLDAPVTRYLPGFTVKGGEASRITVRMLLTHRSGLRREGADPYWMTYDFPSWPTLAAELADAPLEFTPGSRTAYSNVGMAVLGQVIAAAAGEPYADYVASHILAPLGMAASAVGAGDVVPPGLATPYSREKRHLHGARRVLGAGDPRALSPAFGLVTNGADLARFARFLLGADPGGARVLAPDSVKEMMTAQDAGPVWTEARGLGFELEKVKGYLRASHNGWFSGHRAQITLVPELALGVIVLANADDAPVADVASRVLDDMIDAVALARMAPAPASAGSDDGLAALVGLYGAGWLPERDVVLLSDGLWQYTPTPSTSLPVRHGLDRLLPMGGDRFHVGNPDGQVIRFARDADGCGARIVLQDGAVWLERRPD